jgi:hypothetical protein
MLKTIHNKFFYIGLVTTAVLVLAFFILPNFLPVDFIVNSETSLATVSSSTLSTTTIVKASTTTEPVVKKTITHIKTPEPVKAIYMTACVAGTPSFRAKLLKLANETEINTIMIDIKDYTGTVSFSIDHPSFKENAGTGCKVKDMVDFVETLHKNNIYVIGRITAFQDPYLAKVYP